MNNIFPKPTTQLKVGDVSFSFQEVKTVIENFYRQVAVDPLLSVPFSSVEDWPHHIDRLTHFWWTRFGGEPYLSITYNPVGKHYEAGFNQEFLNHWLKLFHKTLGENLNAEQAQTWGQTADRMGVALLAKDRMMRMHFSGSQN